MPDGPLHQSHELNIKQSRMPFQAMAREEERLKSCMIYLAFTFMNLSPKGKKMVRSASGVRDLVRISVCRHGLSGTLRRAMAASGRMACRLPYLRECHVWYRLDLERGWKRGDLPPGFEIVRGGVGELPLVEKLGNVGYVEARRRLDGDADLWLVRHGANPVFAGWIFRRRTPAVAAPEGWLDLPEGIVCLEDLVTAPPYRGRGFAPISYSAIADSLAREGVKAIVVKIEETNHPSRRSVEKAGFRPVATMTLVRIGGMRHVTMELKDGEDASPFLPLLPASEPSLMEWIFGALAPGPIY